MILDIPALLEKVTKEIQEFTDVAVVGLSGGADSTLVATLCTQALGANKVWGVHMPYGETDVKDGKFNARSAKFATMLGIKSLHAPINEVADEISEAVGHALAQETELCSSKELSVLNRGNARSRARMTVLYGIAHHLNENLKMRARVIGTGNLSEDFIGYDTKGGDALCDIFPIGTLFKSEVYQLLDYFRDAGKILDDHIDRVPSAGLWDGHTDEGELGHSYNKMEIAIKKVMANKSSYEKQLFLYAPGTIDRFVLDRHLANKHKHESPGVVNLRDYCD